MFRVSTLCVFLVFYLSEESFIGRLICSPAAALTFKQIE